MIKVLENNELDFDVLEVSDLIDINLLQNFQDNFAISMNCASITVNRHGNPVTKESSYTKFCIGCVQSNLNGKQRCAESHKRMGQESVKMNKPYVGKCHAGLIDFAAPITIDGHVIGTVLGGQISHEKPSVDELKRTAIELNIDENTFLDASSDIQIVNMKNIKAAAEVLYTVVNALATNGYNELKLSILSKKLSDNFLHISSTIEELTASANDISNQQDKLNDEISGIQQITSSISEILSSIKKIAAQIKMLGLNASIEASRVGDAGKCFAVVANEIKKLSENSSETANSISDLVSKIESSVDSTISYSKISLDTTKEQYKAMDEVTKNIQDSVLIADQISNLIELLK